MSLTHFHLRSRPADTGEDASPRRRVVWLDWLHRTPMFLVVGLLSTIAYGLLYLSLQHVMGNQPANAIALVVSTVAGTVGHRRFTFQVHDSSTVVSQQVLGLGVLGAGLAVTSGSLWVLGVADPDASLTVELVVLAAANAVAGLVRFLTFAVVMRGRGAETPGVEA